KILCSGVNNTFKSLSKTTNYINWAIVIRVKSRRRFLRDHGCGSDLDQLPLTKACSKFCFIFILFVTDS
ncbi:hypothetical protein BpHYR1_003689, partial [Brachionus plicatilis]